MRVNSGDRKREQNTGQQHEEQRNSVDTEMP